MPVIVDASIQGKLKHPIIPNVISSNDKPRQKQASGISNVTFENSQKLEASRGRPHPRPTGSNLKETTGLVLVGAGKAISGVVEQSKGLYVSSAG